MTYISLNREDRAAAISSARARLREVAAELARLEAEDDGLRRVEDDATYEASCARAVAVERATFPGEGARRAGVSRLGEGSARLA